LAASFAAGFAINRIISLGILKLRVLRRELLLLLLAKEI
jgi:hypothetical protein